MKVNEEEFTHEEGMTVEDMLKKRDPKMPIVVVRVNGEYISKMEWDRVLKDDDDVTVIPVIAGG